MAKRGGSPRGKRKGKGSAAKGRRAGTGKRQAPRTGRGRSTAPSRRPARKATQEPAAGPEVPEGVVIRRTAEIDPADPLASGATAPLRGVWVDAAREARDEKRVVIDLVGEGRGVIVVPVSFKDEKEAMAAMRPALDVLVRHVMAAGEEKQQPVMVDLQELRERLQGEPADDWLKEHRWFDNALSDRELLCMYVFSPSYLLEFSVAIAKQQGFKVRPSEESAGFYQITFDRDGQTADILWNWARAIGDVIVGGHSWSYFGLLLALAPQVAAQKRARGSSEEE